jgi:hypothetical protein
MTDSLAEQSTIPARNEPQIDADFSQIDFG